MKKDSVKDIVDIIADYHLSVEIYPNAVYVSRKGHPYIEEYVKLNHVGGDVKSAIELAVEKTVHTIENWRDHNVAA